MNGSFVSFDDVRRRAVELLKRETVPDGVRPLYLVRNLFGKVRISVPDAVEADESCRDALRRLANGLGEVLGAHGHPSGNAVLFVEPALLADLDETAQKIDGLDQVYWVDRLMTGGDWWTVSPREAASPPEAPRRCTLFSVKGGVGRSTTASVLAWRLARAGERVLVVDLDLESPGLSSAVLDPGTQPDFGVADWFVEDLVGQGERVVEAMTAEPSWSRDFDGEVRIAPAHGSRPGEYLAKLGRVYMGHAGKSWGRRLVEMLSRLEERHEPTFVLLESRSGLHDVAATAVTDLDAEVLLFATDSESTWTDYGILFRHWRKLGLATDIRERLSIASALTPELDTERYLQGFRQRAWDLFRDHLYDEVDSSSRPGDAFSFGLDDDAPHHPAPNDGVAPSGCPGDEFSFDLDDDDAPHRPAPILWNRGLAAGASLRDPEKKTPAVLQAYATFLKWFDEGVARGDETP